MEWYLGVWKKFAVFSGRARRTEYWMFVLINFIVLIILAVGDGMMGSKEGVQILSLIYNLAVFIPSLSVGARRLHDTDRSGWWQLLWLIPVIGWIVLLVFFCTGGTKASNRFGADPIGAAAPA